MKTPLKVLIVEDREPDADLEVLELRHKFQVSWVRVETEEAYVRELARRPDVVISDYDLPRFSGLRALEILRRDDQVTPFILVSGVIPEGEAAATLLKGATDYLLKSSLVRLAPAIERALDQRRTVLAKAEVEDLYHQSETRYKALFEQAVEAVIVIDATTGVVLEANPRAAELFGVGLDQIVGRHSTSLFPEAMRERCASCMAGLCQDASPDKPTPTTARLEAVIERRDGTRADVDISAALVRVAENRSVVQAFLRDVTERNRLRDELAAQRDKLEETVATRTRELREAVTQLEATVLRLEDANRHKSRFLRNMSHELRTPLNSILGFTDLLTSGFSGHLDAQQLSYIKQIEVGGTHLLNMISDLLDVARIDAGAVVLQPSRFAPTQICEAVTRLLTAQTREKHLHLSVEHDPGVGDIEADLQKARQIMLNLLSNAIKFTPDDGRITIRTVPEGGDWVRIFVSDTGVGIAPDHLPHLFEEFYQSNRSRDQALGGTGIGLALTKRLVELHGGTIDVASVLGEGTTFSFTLPMRPASGRAPSGRKLQGDMPDYVGQLRVLIVSDRGLEAEVLETALLAHHHKAERALSASEARARCAVDPPDALVMDLSSCVDEGLTLAQELRSDANCRATAIILVTADTSRELARRAKSAGCDACLSRPVQPSMVISEIGRLAARRLGSNALEVSP